MWAVSATTADFVTTSMDVGGRLPPAPHIKQWGSAAKMHFYAEKQNLQALKLVL